MKVAKIQTTDLPFFRHLYSSPEVVGHLFKPLTETQIQTAFKKILHQNTAPKPKQLFFIITDQQQNIGITAVYWNQAQHNAVESGTIIDTPYQRQGYARRTKLWMLDHLFSQHAVERVIAKYHSDNSASAAFCQKLGYQPYPTDDPGYSQQSITKQQFYKIRNKP